MPKLKFDPARPVCRSGIAARELVNGMVYIRHSRFSSRVINSESWSFVRLCDGRDLEHLSQAVANLLGFSLSREQLSSSIREFADHGIFEGTHDGARSYRICDASPIVSKISPIVRWLATPWFAGITLFGLLTCLTLLFVDWGRFINAVATAARERPFETLLLYYLTFIPIALVHELGHAIVANFHGGEIPEIVICSNGHFAVITNTSVLKNRSQRIWYLSMGTVADVFFWLVLLAAFHYSQSYLLLMFLLPQTIYFLIYVYSIFKNSDFLKMLCALFEQPVPAEPVKFLRNSWMKSDNQPAKRKLVWVMTASLVIKVLLTAFLIWTFLRIEPRVLILYVLYRLMVYVIGHGPSWWRRWEQSQAGFTDEIKAGS